MGILTLVVVAAYLVGWWAGPFRPSDETVSERLRGPYWLGLHLRYFSATGFLLAAIVAGLMLAWALGEAIGGIRAGRKYLAFRRTVYRSLSPILASAVILVGITCGTVLIRAEADAAAHVISEGSLESRNEINNTGYRMLRERLQKEHDEMLYSPKTQSDCGYWPAPSTTTLRRLKRTYAAGR